MSTRTIASLQTTAPGAFKLVLAGVAALAVAALNPASAGAHLTRFSSSFAVPPGSRPVGVAVDQASGAVYVADRFANQVERFSAAGAPDASFASPALMTPWGVAVDNSAGASKGDVYVSEPEILETVIKLDSTGKPVAGFTPITSSSIPAGKIGSGGPFGPAGLAVDPANGDVVVGDSESGEVDIFSPAGTFIAQFEGGGGLGVAVGAGSSIFTSGGAGAQEWSASDGYSTPTEIDPDDGVGIGVDVASGDVLADDRNLIAEYEASGAPLLQFGSGLLASSSGVAVNEATNSVYVTDASASRVDVFGPPVVVADVSTSTPATNVTSTSASVSGTVNPAGTQVNGCRFEYGLTTAYGAAGACSQAPPLTGNSPVTQTASLVGLEPNATYHYRLSAVNANGPSYGEDETFFTPPAPPSLYDQSASAVTQTSAILNASVNPNNQSTTYRFELGTSTAYGTTLPVPDGQVGSGYGAFSVGQAVSGLIPGTTYHLRVVATNATGVVTGADQTFTTLPLLPPIAATGGASGISASAATISGTVDPQGVQTTYEFDLGVDTGYGTRIFGEAGSGNQAQTFEASLVELTPNTTYHYRLIATNVFGTSYGADEAFTTPAVPGALLLGPAATPLVPTPPFLQQAAASTSRSGAAARKSGAKRASRSKHTKMAGKPKRKTRGRSHLAAGGTQRTGLRHRGTRRGGR